MIKKKAIKKYNYMKNTAIILACGESQRFKYNSPKQYTELSGDIILNQTIKIFLKNDKIDLILLVLNKKRWTTNTFYRINTIFIIITSY